jgi:hypothetical protein
MVTKGPLRPALKITTAEWLELVRPLLEKIADSDYQQLLWPKGKGASADDLIGDLMDGHGFDETVRSPVLKLSDQERTAAVQFAETMDAFVDKVHGRFDDVAMLSNPDWHTVRQAAADLLKILPS